MRIKHLSLLCSALLLSQASFAADKPSWDVSADHGKTKTISFNTDEGTWLDLDVSPDGNSIVFSMMGDIYLMPISGGNAQRISSGPAWDVQPRFSPNGKEIAFTSDRAGGNNLWRMNRDGSASKQVTKESFRLFNNPIWTPDGQYLIGRKHFTSERSLGAGELWMTHRDGGEGLQLTKRKNDQMDLGEPAISPDGRYVYYSEDVSDGDTFSYNKNVYEVIYAIKRQDRDTGETQTLINTPGGAMSITPGTTAVPGPPANLAISHAKQRESPPGAVRAVRGQLPRAVLFALGLVTLLGMAFQLDQKIIRVTGKLPGQRGKDPLPVLGELGGVGVKNWMAVLVEDADAHPVRSQLQIDDIIIRVVRIALQRANQILRQFAEHVEFDRGSGIEVSGAASHRLGILVGNDAGRILRHAHERILECALDRLFYHRLR